MAVEHPPYRKKVTHLIQKPGEEKKAPVAEEVAEAVVSLCPLCHTRNKGENPKNKKPASIVHTCSFCHYVYCAACG